MNEKIKLADKKKLENIITKNKKRRSKVFIDDTSAATTTNINQNHLLKSHNNFLHKSNNVDFENVEYINNILAEKINSLSISNDNFISSGDKSSNEDIKPNKYVKPNYNENIIIHLCKYHSYLQ